MIVDHPKNRPTLLTWLCAVSVISGLLWIVMYITLIFYSLSGNVPSALFPGIVLDYLHAGYTFVISEIILTSIGISSVFLMWQMKKNGFYLYAITKTIIYFLPVLVIGSNHLHFPGLAITSVMIIMYGVIFTNLQKTSLEE